MLTTRDTFRFCYRAARQQAQAGPFDTLGHRTAREFAPAMLRIAEGCVQARQAAAKQA